MWIIAVSTLALFSTQEPSATVGGSERTETEAQVDVCLFTPASGRDPACNDLLQAEARLVPDSAFEPGVADSIAWSRQACTGIQLEAGQSTADCRRDQRGLYRRAERARQALGAGVATGLHAESRGYTSGPGASSAGDVQGSAFSESRRRFGDNCEQQSRSRRDQDTGSSSSSASFSCSFGTGDPESREAARRALESVMADP